MDISKDDIRNAAREVATAVIENPSSLPYLIEGFGDAVRNNAETVEALEFALSDLQKQIDLIKTLRSSFGMKNPTPKLSNLIQNAESPVIRPTKKAATVVKAKSSRITIGDMERSIKTLIKDQSKVVNMITESYGTALSEKLSSDSNWFKTSDIVRAFYKEKYGKEISNSKVVNRLQKKLMHTMMPLRKSGALVSRGNKFTAEWCLISNPLNL